MHSVFARSLNIEWHDGRLIALHGPGHLAAPFAAALSRWPWGAGLRAGAAVRRRDGRLHLADVALETAGAGWVDLSIRPGAGDPSLVAKALGEGAPCRAARSLASAAALTAQRRLFDGIRHCDAEAFLAGARGLVGYGEGLTPAGDDCLVGVLAALHRFGPDSPAIHADVKGPLAQAAQTETTAVACEFLLHALEGVFSEPVCELMAAASETDARHAAARLSAMGATSGADTLAGLCLALHALAGTPA